MTDTTFADEIAASATSRPRGFHISPGHIPLGSRALTLQVVVGLYMLFHVALIGLSLYSLWFIQTFLNNGFETEEAFNSAANLVESGSEYMSILQIGTLVICVIAYSFFIYRAASNIAKSNAKGLDYSPAWSVGWSFIPIANIFAIFTVMRGIWIASHDPRRGAYGVSVLLPVWWACYVGGNIVANLSNRLSEGAMQSLDFGLISAFIWTGIAASGASILAGVLLIMIVGSITRAQAGWKTLAAETAEGAQ